VSDPTSPLSQQELDLLQRILGDPLSFPSNFKRWVTGWIEANPPQLSLAQLPGAGDWTPFLAANESESHFTRTTFGDPDVSGPSGPTLSNLPNGKYVVLWGGSGTGDGTSAGDASFMAVSVNGSSTTNALETQLQGIHGSVARADIVTLSAGDGLNTLKCVYKVTIGHNADFRARWIVAIKYSNL
jgi:hypothetical protein